MRVILLGLLAAASQLASATSSTLTPTITEAIPKSTHGSQHAISRRVTPFKAFDKYDTLEEFKLHEVGPNVSEPKSCRGCFFGPSLNVNWTGDGASAVPKADGEFLFCLGQFVAAIIPLGANRYIPDTGLESCTTNSYDTRALYLMKPRFGETTSFQFEAFPNLDTLAIVGGDINTFMRRTLSGSYNLVSLDLSMNKLTGFDLRILERQRHLASVNLTGNPINCNEVCVDPYTTLYLNKNVRFIGKCRTYTDDNMTQFVEKEIQDEYLRCNAIYEAYATSPSASPVVFTETVATTPGAPTKVESPSAQLATPTRHLDHIGRTSSQATTTTANHKTVPFQAAIAFERSSDKCSKFIYIGFGLAGFGFVNMLVVSALMFTSRKKSHDLLVESDSEVSVSTKVPLIEHQV